MAPRFLILAKVCSGFSRDLASVAPFFTGLVSNSSISKTNVIASELVKYAIDQGVEHETNAKRGDQIWCVFDVDSKTQAQIREAVDLARKHRVGIALSNPSFELWYLLHFCYTSSQMQNAELLERLREADHLPQYKKNESVFNSIVGFLDEAVRRAEQLRQHHRNLGNDVFTRAGNPSTMVADLVKAIREQ